MNPPRGIPARRPRVANTGGLRREQCLARSSLASRQAMKCAPATKRSWTMERAREFRGEGSRCCAHEADAVCVVLLERALGRRRNHIPYLGYMHSHVQNAESRCAHTGRSLSYPAAGYGHFSPASERPHPAAGGELYRRAFLAREAGSAQAQVEPGPSSASSGSRRGRLGRRRVLDRRRRPATTLNLGRLADRGGATSMPSGEPPPACPWTNGNLRHGAPGR
jgi:hypothetical protein